jgi:hypothetical protein
MGKNIWVTKQDQSAFKAEMPTLRHELRALKRERWDKAGWHRHSLVGLMQRWQQLQTVHRRLEYWRDQLMYDRTRIKSPVRLWDAWHRVQMEAEVCDWDLRGSIAECADSLGVARPLDPEVPGYSEAPAREMSIEDRLYEKCGHRVH